MSLPACPLHLLTLPTDLTERCFSFLPHAAHLFTLRRACRTSRDLVDGSLLLWRLARFWGLDRTDASMRPALLKAASHKNAEALGICAANLYFGEGGFPLSFAMAARTFRATADLAARPDLARYRNGGCRFVWGEGEEARSWSPPPGQPGADGGWGSRSGGRTMATGFVHRAEVNAARRRGQGGGGVIYGRATGDTGGGPAIVGFPPSVEAGELAAITEAEYSLGCMIMRGRGTAVDPLAAMQWFRRAAVKGDSRALFNMAALLWKEPEPGAAGDEEGVRGDVGRGAGGGGEEQPPMRSRSSCCRSRRSARNICSVARVRLA